MRFVILGLCCSIGLLSMIPLGQPTTQPAQQAQTYFLEQLTQLRQALDQLQEALQQKDQANSAATYQQVRRYFKRAETLLAYLSPQLYERTLNESPLLKPKPYVANKEIHEPRGLQVLDETLFAPSPDWNSAQTLTHELQTHLRDLQVQLSTTVLHDALIIHAIKEELLRSFTLGVSGFDTPGSGAAIHDLQAVLEGISQLLTAYDGRFESSHLQTIQTLIQSVQYTTFEDFDRYGYLVEQLIPMLEHLEAIRESAHLASKEELQQLPTPLNSRFTNLFQKDLLHTTYYAQLPTQEVTDARVALGKRLFNDPFLSKSLKTSCSTCHRSEAAFTDQLARSQNGDGSATTQRNAPSLNYAVLAGAYFYDLRAHGLHHQFDHVIHDTKEFNTNYPTLIKKLNHHQDYLTAFQAAYPSYPTAINTATINHALKCYLVRLPSFDAPFDRWVQQKKTDIPQEVRQGFNLFMGKAQCGTCHFPPTFSGLVPPAYVDSESEVLGVLVDEQYDQPVLDPDLGRMHNGIIKDRFAFFKHSFKTVSIRNVAQTAPYMHNGSIQTLEQVVEFYNRGGGAGMGLELPYQTLSAEPLDLSATEKAALVAFMKTLSDAAYQ